MPRSIQKIVEDDRSNWQKAEECLTALDSTKGEVAGGFRFAAVTFAILALIEQLQDSGRE